MVTLSTGRPVNLWKAIHEIQSEISFVHKDAVNPHFKSRYATLGAVLDVVRPSALNHGVIIMQTPGLVVDGCIHINNLVVHAETGESIDFSMTLPLARGDPQSAGAAISYGCRYSLMSFFALSALEDDDAEEASRPDTRPQASSPRAAGSGGGSADRTGTPPTKLSDRLSDAPSLAMFGKLKDQMLKFKTKTELADWAKGDVNPVINSLQEADFQTFRALYSERLKELPA